MLKKSKLDKERATYEMDTLIHQYMSEQSLWDITHSDFSKRVSIKRHQDDSNENVIDL